MAFNNKYDPKTLDDLVIDPNNKHTLELFATKQLTDHLLLEGPNGTGKTTITTLLPELTHGQNYDVEEVMGHDEFVINNDVLYTWDNFIGWCRAQHMASYIVINEIDKIKKNLPLFWQWLDTRRSQVTVIGTTNQFMTVPKAMRSRMKCLTLAAIKAIDMLPRAQEILVLEQLQADSNFLLDELISVQQFGDIRKYMERLERVAIDLRSGAVNYQGYVVAPKRPKMQRVK